MTASWVRTRTSGISSSKFSDVLLTPFAFNATIFNHLVIRGRIILFAVPYLDMGQKQALKFQDMNLILMLYVFLRFIIIENLHEN